MKIGVTGSSGLVGSQLVPELEKDGHHVIRIVRRVPENEHEIRWSPERGEMEPADLEGLDAIVHLAGEGIASGRWDEAKKRRILESRVEPTKLLCKTMASMDQPPHTLLAASAIGYYGDRGDQICREDDPPGDDFLADVCCGWELATDPAQGGWDPSRQRPHRNCPHGPRGGPQADAAAL